ncbi:Lysophospholipase; Monoglyceride lipase; putative [hydrothermal vent metagenome]|uniref:Lysophospholipase Monoglyceride lipase putative n=1 Tax=hydrothermal vent metagenome TaxID=652676 RepID=A0A3B0R5E8_9ZZZZ
MLTSPSKAAGAELYRQSWLPEGDPKAVIILIHGYDEHSGRYQYFAEHCTNRGFAVHALDHWGHGKSEGDNGFVPEFSVYHDGVDKLIGELTPAHTGLPRILVGHSLGGLISATYLLKNQAQFAAAVLSGPAIKAADEPSVFLKFISRLLSKFLPKMGVIGFDPNGVSRDPKVVADYLADPLVSGSKISARLGHEMMTEMNVIENEAASISLPLLMLHGADDSVVAPEGSSFLNDHISSVEKKLKIYPGLFHEIFNEPEKDAVLADMTDWIDTQLPGEVEKK